MDSCPQNSPSSEKVTAVLWQPPILPQLHGQAARGAARKQPKCTSIHHIVHMPSEGMTYGSERRVAQVGSTESTSGEPVTR